MQAGMPAAFQFFILALLSKQPPLYGFLVLKPGCGDRLMADFSRSHTSFPTNLSCTILSDCTCQAHQGYFID
ncbi:hypothetical protein [Microcoleus sp. CAWBG58]|uniref:hypothetical protein n=1 Tax=Microcoleus sp. CAWBG58 TaxID=2841651 RepID=UPI0025EAFDD8|nr:hypothetical protein [Microcoleus sp. CAWBG58]